MKKIQLMKKTLIPAIVLGGAVAIAVPIATACSTKPIVRNINITCSGSDGSPVWKNTTSISNDKQYCFLVTTTDNNKPVLNADTKISDICGWYNEIIKIHDSNVTIDESSKINGKTKSFNLIDGSAGQDFYDKRVWPVIMWFGYSKTKPSSIYQDPSTRWTNVIVPKDTVWKKELATVTFDIS